MLKSQIALADVGPENRVCVICLCEHRKGGVPGSLQTSGTREAVDKPPSISTPDSVPACSCQTTRSPVLITPSRKSGLLCRLSEPFAIPPAQTDSHFLYKCRDFIPCSLFNHLLQKTQARCINPQRQAAAVDGQSS